MLIIHVLDLLLGVMLGLLTINEIHSLGLRELVDFSTCDTDEEFFGELVGDGLACQISCKHKYIPSITRREPSVYM